MHISFLTPEYPHEKVAHAAGIGTSIKNLVVALVAKNIQVSVFVYGQNYSEVFLENGIKFHLIKHKKHQFGTWFFYRKYLQNYINSYIKKDNIDLIEAPDWTGITSFMNFEIPLIIRFHGSDAYFCNLENRKQKLKNYWFEKLALNKATAYIAPTLFAGNLTQKIFNLTENKIKVIHHGIDLNFFRNENPELFQKKLMLYIGTIIRKKGVLELPEIFKKVLDKNPDAQLILIGGDAPDITTNSKSTWKMFQNQCTSESLKSITYLNKLDYKSLQNKIMNAHICVFPTFAETLGMVTIEAMAMKKPVITSTMGWTKELIIDNESGFLVDPKNHEEFANAINTIFENVSLLENIGNNARNRVENLFDIRKIVNQNIDFYQSIISKK